MAQTEHQPSLSLGEAARHALVRSAASTAFNNVHERVRKLKGGVGYLLIENALADSDGLTPSVRVIAGSNLSKRDRKGFVDTVTFVPRFNILDLALVMTNPKGELDFMETPLGSVFKRREVSGSSEVLVSTKHSALGPYRNRLAPRITTVEGVDYDARGLNTYDCLERREPGRVVGIFSVADAFIQLAGKVNEISPTPLPGR